jgi:hypothetical protein
MNPFEQLVFIRLIGKLSVSLMSKPDCPELPRPLSVGVKKPSGEVDRQTRNFGVRVIGFGEG